VRSAGIVGTALLGAALLFGCSSDGGSDTAPAPASTTVVDVASTGGRTPLDGFGTVLVEVTAADGSTCEVCLLLAETPAQRSQGLMEVTEPTLGGFDGMLFAFEERPGSGGFWMRNTRLPLTGVFFDTDGRFLEALPMVPCPDETSDGDCPRYGPGQDFGTVIELTTIDPAEVLMVEGSTIERKGSTCPVELAGRS
jgi:uncharacterized membrane protein (UPF0127 family)